MTPVNSKWRKGKLDELRIEFVDGDRSARYPKRSEFVEQGVPFLNAESISSGRLEASKANYVSLHKFESITKGRLKPGDLILTTRGNGVGKPAFFDGPSRPALINAQLLILRPDQYNIYPKYFYYSFCDPDFQFQIRNFVSGSAQPQLPIHSLRNVVYRYPPLPTQRKIASILSAYDDLIENNTRRIAILKEMAQAIYREWFVNFRFPDHENVKLVDSPLGQIPEGWEVATVSEFGRVITGKTPSKKVPENFGDYMPFIKTPSMHGNTFCIEVEEFLSEIGVETQRKKTLPPDTVIVNCIGALAGSVSITVSDSQTNQQINAVVFNSLEAREFLYLTLVGLRDTIRSHGSAGATMINLSKGKFEALPVVKPAPIVLSTFHDITCPILNSIKNIQRRNVVLRSTRDLLLPKLISGKLDVEDLDIDVGMTTEALDEAVA